MSRNRHLDDIFSPKLVRDRFPEILDHSGGQYQCRKVEGQELKRLVGMKLLEEAHELFRAWQQTDPQAILSEAADLLEITLKALALEGFECRDLWRAQEEKRRLRGAFERDIALEHIGSPASGCLETNFPRVLFIPVDHSILIELMRALLARSRRVSIASAFYTPAVTNLLLNDLNRFTEQGGDLRIILSTMGNINNPEHLQYITEYLPGAQVRIFHPAEVPVENAPPGFHAKAYLFERNSGEGSLIIGSSNFTRGGFLANVEWNYYSSTEVNLPFDGRETPFVKTMREFDRVWSDEAVELNDEFLIVYRGRYRPVRSGESFIWNGQAPYKPARALQPNAAQREALDRLATLRSEGVRQAAVVAATGIGKTYLAAFDFKQSDCNRVLFIAHREMIVRQARATFADVLRQEKFGVIIGGGNHVDQPPEAAFAMIQTLSRPEHLQRFPRDHFNYIVIDEFHHAAAESYERVLKHFKPRFLLGLTATPERADGGDVLRYCGYNVAYEVRLLEAVDRGWLAPFQYYAIFDDTDYEQIKWRGTHYDQEELDYALSNDTRTHILAHNLRKFLPSLGKIKALAFCSSIAHAKYTARMLTEQHGIEAAALVGEHTEHERQRLIQSLQDEDDPLKVICCVDVFNEGIDIPCLSHVLLLRPTQSFTLFLQQIGRGLRRAPGKDFLVVIDFVGNYRKVYVAPLALMGYTSLEEASQELQNRDPIEISPSLPRGCFVDPETEVRRIWELEVRRIISAAPRRERLKALYQEIREGLGASSPQLMDFFWVSAKMDPKAFILEFGSWLRAKLYCDDKMREYEKNLLNTPGEAFLKHLETQLKPSRSYKMVVLKVILDLPGVAWQVEDIAGGFLRFYLENRDKLFDYEALAKTPNPANYPRQRVRAHIVNMPLKYLSNSKRDWFLLDDKKDIFRLRGEIAPYWKDPQYKELIHDRVQFELTRYFQRRRLQQVVCFDESILEWGFSLEPSFAEYVFFRTRNGIELRDNLNPGERRHVKLTYQGRSHRVSLERPGMSGHYRLNYSEALELIDHIRKRFTQTPRSGEKVFVLRRISSRELALSDVL